VRRACLRSAGHGPVAGNDVRRRASRSASAARRHWQRRVPGLFAEVDPGRICRAAKGRASSMLSGRAKLRGGQNMGRPVGGRIVSHSIGPASHDRLPIGSQDVFIAGRMVPAGPQKCRMIDPTNLSDAELGRLAPDGRRRALHGDLQARCIAHELGSELRRRSGARFMAFDTLDMHRLRAGQKRPSNGASGAVPM
jgi:hypothetical protein